MIAPPPPPASVCLQREHAVIPQAQEYFAKVLECHFAASGVEGATNSSVGTLARLGCSSCTQSSAPWPSFLSRSSP